MTITELNEALAKFADGRVFVKHDENVNVFYTYDDFVGLGKAVQGTFEEAIARVMSLPAQNLRYVMPVEYALSHEDLSCYGV